MRLVLRIGLATGEAVAAGSAVSEFMVTGEVPNLAARLQAVGEGITVSETTHRLLAPRLEAEPPGGLPLKGFPGPITAYRARGLRAAERRALGVAGLSSPVVGPGPRDGGALPPVSRICGEGGARSCSSSARPGSGSHA